MGLLSQDYYDSLKQQQAPTTPANSNPQVNPVQNPPVEPLNTPSPNLAEPNIQPKTIKAEDAASSLFSREVGTSFGLNLPSEDKWLQMNPFQQGGSLLANTPLAVARMVKDLPRALTRDVLSLGVTVTKPFYDLVTKGKLSSVDDLGSQAVIKLPWVGEIPSMYQTTKQMQDSGSGPLASALLSGANTFLQVTQAAGLGELFSGSFRPRGKIAPGETLQNTAPIKYAMDSDGVFKSKPEGSVSEYYTAPKTVSKSLGGNESDIKWKVTPAGTGNVELSVTKSVSAKPGTYVETPYGMKLVQEGDFGPEIKLQSQTVKTSNSLSTPTTVNPQDIFIEPRPKIGFEKAPITQGQIDTLGKIGTLKAIDPEMTDAIVRTITGKTNIGELTQTEYTNVAQTLSKFGDKYVAPNSLGPAGWVYSKIAPQRHLFDYIEERHGIPLKSEVYNPIEEGTRLADRLAAPLNQEFTDIFGKYKSAKYLEERRLIDSYARGDTAAITTNSAIDIKTKTELMDIAGKLRNFYNETGPILNVPTDVFLNNYLPRISDLGGVVQKYKDLSKVPGEYEFFAKQKRNGSLNTLIDDPLSTGQIYIRQGTRALHLGPALERSKALIDNLPQNFKDIANNYVQEKMGYAGKVEKFVDSFVPSFNKGLNKIGINLPADASRQAINFGLSNFYSGILSSPATAFRQLFQVPTFVYGRLGPNGMSEAVVKSLTKAGREEAAKAGVLLDQFDPYGAELTKESTVGGRILEADKKLTGAVIKPTTVADNFGRTVAFHQGKIQWEEALQQYNTGKITWPQLEGKIDLKAFGNADRNLIRQKLISGDMSGAFDTYIRGVIDDTSFPYRKAASAQMSYGLPGKLGTGLMTYSIESGNVLSNWAKTGQWEKLIRLAAGAKTTHDTLQDTFGFDFGKSFSVLQQFGGLMSPFVKGMVDSAEWLDAWRQNNKQIMNENSDAIFNTLTSAVPAGVLGKNLLNFKKSYEAGADANGKYPIYDASGKLKYTGDFSELFWSTAMGFPTIQKQQDMTQHANIQNDIYTSQQTQQKMNELLRAGKYDELDTLMKDNPGIAPSAGGIQSKYIPRNVRDFQSLPGYLKAKYAKILFPNQ